MANLEIKVEKLDERVSSLEQRVTETTTNVNSLIRELKDFKDEMRDRDNQRAQDIREIRASLDGMGKHVQNLTVAAMVGVGTSVIAVVVMVGTMVYTILSR